jgi:hypothetical protein
LPSSYVDIIRDKRFRSAQTQSSFYLKMLVSAANRRLSPATREGALFVVQTLDV